MVSTKVPRTHLRFGRRRAVLSAALALAVGASVFGVHWLYSPHLIVRGGALISTPDTVGRTMYFGDIVFTSSSPRDRVVDLRSVTPRITTNTASAEVRMWVCAVGDAGQVGDGETSLGRCVHATPFAPGRRDIGDAAGKFEVVAAITPRAPGVVEVRGFDVHYRDGIRRGHATTGIDIELRVSA